MKNDESGMTQAERDECAEIAARIEAIAGGHSTMCVAIATMLVAAKCCALAADDADDAVVGFTALFNDTKATLTKNFNTLASRGTPQ